MIPLCQKTKQQLKKQRLAISCMRAKLHAWPTCASDAPTALLQKHAAKQRVRCSARVYVLQHEHSQWQDVKDHSTQLCQMVWHICDGPTRSGGSC